MANKTINDFTVQVPTGDDHLLFQNGDTAAGITNKAIISDFLTKTGGVFDASTATLRTGGLLRIDVDGTALNNVGSITFGLGADAGAWFDGTDFIIQTDGAGASGIILDSEDDTVEIKGSGTLQATFDTDGLDLVSGDAYYIDNVQVLSNSSLGAGIINSSLTNVGTLSSLTVSGTAQCGVFNVIDATGAGIVSMLNQTDNPPADTIAGTVNFKAENDSQNVIIYASVHGKVTDDTAASEDGYLSIELMTGGATEEKIRVWDSGGITIVNIDSASSSSQFRLSNLSATPAADTLLGVINFFGKDDAGTDISYGNVRGYVTDDTAGSVDGYVNVYARKAGTNTEVLRCDGPTESVSIGGGGFAPTATLHVDQSDGSGAKPCVKLDQGDTDETFIDYIGTSSADAASSISSWTTGASIQGFVRVDINGVQRWMPFYDAPTS